MPYLSVIVPAFNEESRISGPLTDIAGYLEKQPYEFELICVNDGSTDRTEEILNDFAVARPYVKVVSYEMNHGKGFAVKQGVVAAAGEYVLFSDADLNTPIEEMTKLMSVLDCYDIAIGSRAHHKQNRPLIRELGSRFLNLLIRTLAVPGIRDTQCGFKLFRKEAAQAVFSRSKIERFSFDIEILYLARKLGYKVLEVPVEWHYKGGSKVQPVKDGLRFILDIIKIRRYHRKVGSA